MSKKNVWEMLESYFSDDRFDYYCEGVNEGEILSAEKDLNLSFSPYYTDFLKKYGGAMIKGDLIYGLRYQADMDESCWSVIDNTKFFKEKQNWPGIEDWYIVSDDGSGNPIGINHKGEVWLSDHNSSFEQIKLADNFEEFLYKLLTDTLYE